MFDIGWLEMMVVAIVMIVIIGPKDLPVVLHTMGRWVSRIRVMARGFQESIEEMANEAGLDEVRREATSLTDYDIAGDIEKSIDPDGEIRESLSIEDGTEADTDNKIEPEKPKKKEGKDSAPEKAGESEPQKPAAETEPETDEARAHASGDKR